MDRVAETQEAAGAEDAPPAAFTLNHQYTRVSNYLANVSCPLRRTVRSLPTCGRS